MTDTALSAGIPLEYLFMVSPPGGIGAAGAGRFIWDNYASSIRRQFDGYVSPARSKLYRYAALAKNGPIAADVPMTLELGALSSETPLERATRKLAEYQALAEAQANSWVDSREVRAREKSTRDDFITLEDKYDADLQRPGGLDLSGLMGTPPKGPDSVPLPDEHPPVGGDEARADANDPNLSDLPDRWSGLELHLTHRMGEPRFGAILHCHYGVEKRIDFGNGEDMLHAFSRSGSGNR